MTGESISAIGNYGGLGSTGLYGSYYDPSMMAAMANTYGNYGMTNPMINSLGSYSMTNPMMSNMGMMGMMGMYNPTFMAQQTEMMKQMYSAQNEIEKMQLFNQTEMHAAKEEAQVYNNAVHQETFFRNLMEDGFVKQSVREIYNAIRDGKMNYVVQKYFELKQELLNKHYDYFNKNSIGGLNDDDGIREAISVLYSEIGAGFNGGVKPDLRQDILAYGENPFQHGFNTSFMGNKGHTTLTAEETLYQIHGTPVEDKGSKEKAHWLGGKAGNVAEVIVAGGAGAAAGATAWTAAKIFTPSWLGKIVPKAVKGNKVISAIGNYTGKLGTWAKVGALALAAGDVFWQMTRS